MVNKSAPLKQTIVTVAGKVIFLATLCLIPAVAIPFGTIEPWWRGLYAGLVLLLWGGRLIHGSLSGNVDLKWRPLIPVLALICLALIQLIPIAGGEHVAGVNVRTYTLSADPYETKLFIFHLIALALNAELLLYSTQNERRMRTVISVVIGVGVASALFGLMRQSLQGNQVGFVLPYLQSASNGGYGQFVNRNHFAFLMEMVMGLILGLILGRGVRRDRVLINIALLIPLWVALVLSNSRGGLGAMIGQILFLTFFASYFTRIRSANPSHQERSSINRFSRIGLKIGLASLLMLGMILAIVWTGGDEIVNRIENTSSELDEDVSGANLRVGRLDVWKDSWGMIKDNPIFGVGFGGYLSSIPQYHRGAGQMTPQQAHNDYLELIASGGIVGGLIGFCLIFDIFRRALNQINKADISRRAQILGALTGIIGVAIHSVVDFGLHITINSLIFVILAIVAIAEIDDIDQKSDNRDSQKTTRFTIRKT